MTQEFARLAVAVGHVALINLAMKAGMGRMLLTPFRGRRGESPSRSISYSRSSHYGSCSRPGGWDYGAG